MLKYLLILILFANSSLAFTEELKTSEVSKNKEVFFDIFVSTNIKNIRGIDKPTLKKLINTDPAVRRNTIISLGVRGKSENLPVLFTMLYDPDTSVQCAGVMAITEIGNEKAAKYLIEKYYRSSDNNVRDIIIEALGELQSKDSLPFLKALLKNAYPGFRHEALKSLGKINDPETYPLIAEMLDDESEGVKITASRLAAELNVQEAVPLLVKNLNHPVLQVRAACAAALGVLGSKDSLKELKALLKDKDEQVRNSANLAIDKINERLKNLKGK